MTRRRLAKLFPGGCSCSLAIGRHSMNYLPCGIATRLIRPPHLLGGLHLFGMFSRSLNGHVGCARFTEHGLYVCGHEPHQGFELGLSLDEGETARPVMHLKGIKEPLTCASQSTAAQVCTPSIWDAACKNTQRCDWSGVSLPVHTSEFCTAEPRSRSSDESGASCGCHGAGRSSSGALFGTLAAAALCWMRRRRMRQAGSRYSVPR